MDNSILNSKVRLAIYVITGIVNLVSVYLVTIGVFGAAEAALVNGISVFVCGLAGVNTPK